MKNGGNQNLSHFAPSNCLPPLPPLHPFPDLALEQLPTDCSIQQTFEYCKPNVRFWLTMSLIFPKHFKTQLRGWEKNDENKNRLSKKTVKKAVNKSITNEPVQTKTGKQATFSTVAFFKNTCPLSLQSATSGYSYVSLTPESSISSKMPSNLAPSALDPFDKHLVGGGWTNPFEKYANVNLDPFPRVRGENLKKMKPPPRYTFVCFVCVFMLMNLWILCDHSHRESVPGSQWYWSYPSPPALRFLLATLSRA